MRGDLDMQKGMDTETSRNCEGNALLKFFNIRPFSDFNLFLRGSMEDHIMNEDIL